MLNILANKEKYGAISSNAYSVDIPARKKDLLKRFLEILCWECCLKTKRAIRCFREPAKRTARDRTSIQY
jgi:hypothetical protein